jgi:CRP/FNR family cyclic AMP-dependent transcriptional regulator
MPPDPDLPESITPMRDVRRFVRRFSLGETIFERGEAGRCLYIVTRGMVEIRQPVDDGGAGLLLRRVEAGDCFGEIALLEGGTRTASALAAADPTELAEIDKARFVYLVGQQPAFALTLMRSMARRLRGSDPRPADGPR